MFLLRFHRPLAVLFSLALLAGCGQPPAVETGTVQRRTLTSTVSVSGVIQPAVEVPIASDVSGEVVRVRVEEGDRVRKGDLLFSIRPDSYEAALEQSQAALNAARADLANAKAAVTQAENTLAQDSVDFRRAKQLYDDKAIPQQQFEQARLKLKLSKSALQAAMQSKEGAYFRVENARASVRQAKDNLQRTRVYASMDGTVTMMKAKLGQRVVGTGMMAGTEVVKIADLTTMEVQVEVNENDIVDLQLGDTASIEVDAFPDKVFTGKVVEVGFSPVGAGASDAVASATGSSTDQVTNYPVKIQILRRSYINDKDVMGSLPEHQSPFRPGMSGVVEIFTDRAENVLSVPIQAVTVDRDADDEEQRIVFAIGTENKAEKIQVRTGISDTEHLEIKSGLKAGQEIITGPYTLVTKKLKAGMEVRKTDADKESKEGAADETGDDD